MDRFLIRGGNPLCGSVSISGSKNATLALMAAALLGESPTTLYNVPDLRDTRTMADVLRHLGAKVDFDDHVMRIDPSGFSNHEAPYDMVRKMRASVYVMGPMLARLGKANVSMPGGCAIGPRPIDLHLKGFEALGANLRIEHGNVVAEVPKLRGNEFSLSGAAGSSVGATCNVLMAAVLAEGETVIHGAAREPEVCELVALLRKMGAEIEGAGTRDLRIRGVKTLRGVEHTVVADRIEAGTFMVAAAITNGELTIVNAPLDHMDAVISKLYEIGVKIETSGSSAHVVGNFERYSPTNIQTWTYPGFPTDMQAQFMALLSLVPGTSIIRETIYVDRFLHAAELNRMGANIKVLNGIATIQGVPKLSGAPVMASDLRASAALVLAGLAAEGTTIVNRVYHIDRGYEAIEKKLQLLGGDVVRITDNEPEDIASPSQ
ncbi:MAG: UDP-N-acetylglucosamine 1-carboxyvinyltransferase [Candidatus Hydrogenedentota bacterium]|uniref:UDP-N-acetylglucosamine 1-carboxyvinyltransferase n=1 Tax=Sumerlaea chitinivorans TaxID=2250252 RepID=A0A2Z4Y3C3_SUMC1|nr:UDP-N-acetylglucosamine 1-carboxyvinyltransferase [Candidatus Sumerlaea chitinivorans]RMH28924.1 MAG: UDP-N-acetylglucosamine 1-carboxyvinyltransferase [Candidatus Hydrogenedentota bacterium]GIX44627.1 MAG: UDP-N-acetylglucosamine 1-carboxyvinyltransferase [Candidatus Sumerlaea sp.]